MSDTNHIVTMARLVRALARLTASEEARALRKRWHEELRGLLGVVAAELQLARSLTTLQGEDVVARVEAEQKLSEALADNAALRKAVDVAGHALGGGHVEAAQKVLEHVAAADHPGAALLESHRKEVEALRERVRRLEEALRALLLSRDVAWDTQDVGHDWGEAVRAAQEALE